MLHSFLGHGSFIHEEKADDENVDQEFKTRLSTWVCDLEF